MAIIATMKNSKSTSKVRKLKVYEKALVYGAGLAYSTTVCHPEIRLIGKWLADCGFQPGQYVDVTVEPNKLIITHNSENVEMNNEGVKTLC